MFTYSLHLFPDLFGCCTCSVAVTASFRSFVQVVLLDVDPDPGFNSVHEATCKAVIDGRGENYTRRSSHTLLPRPQARALN